jgi:hypothetical protein
LVGYKRLEGLTAMATSKMEIEVKVGSLAGVDEVGHTELYVGRTVCWMCRGRRGTISRWWGRMLCSIGGPQPPNGSYVLNGRG